MEPSRTVKARVRLQNFPYEIRRETRFGQTRNQKADEISYNRL